MAAITTPDMLAAALEYAEHGYRVLPLHTPRNSSAPTPDGEFTGGCSCNRSECVSPGKHPRTQHGVLDSTSDVALVRRFWSVRWPTANIGIACGNGLVVLDIDPRHNGDDSLAKLEMEYGRLPATATVRTGSGGLHFYFAGHARSSKSIRDGIDLQANGSYVVAPPSLHPTGNRYSWENKVQLAALPTWLGALASRVRPQLRSHTFLTDIISKGGRNDALFRCGCAMRRLGFSFEAILAALSIENAARCIPPLDGREVRRAAVQAAQYPPGNVSA